MMLCYFVYCFFFKSVLNYFASRKGENVCISLFSVQIKSQYELAHSVSILDFL